MSLIERIGGAGALPQIDIDENRGAQGESRVPVSLPRPAATPAEWTNALLDRLGYEPADIEAFEQAHSAVGRLRDYIASGMEGSNSSRRVRSARPDPRCPCAGVITLRQDFHQQLVDFIAQRHPERGAQTVTAGGAAQTLNGAALHANAARRRQQVEAQPRVTAQERRAQEVAQVKREMLEEVIGEGGVQVAGATVLGASRLAPAALPEVAPLAIGSLSALGMAVILNRMLDMQIERQLDAAPPPFPNNQPLPPPPPLINPDQSEQGHRLSEPLTTPATPPNIATGTPPMTNPQPLPPPPLITTPTQEQDPLAHVFMATFPGATTEESIRIKLDLYLLNPDHPVGGPKAKWYEQALGFNRSNAGELARQLVFDPSVAVPTVMTEYGQKFEQLTLITGANGRQIEVGVVWITNPDGVTRLVTAPPSKK